MEHSNVDPRRLFIVVIDDSETVCKLLQGLLIQEGHQVTCFLDPVSALRSMIRGEVSIPDLLFIDLVLPPPMDGYEVIKHVRSNPTSLHIPIVVISRLGDAVSRLKARLAGANAFLEKPFQAQDVLMLARYFAASTNPTIPENK